MKKDLSSLDIHYLVAELRESLIDSKVDKVFLKEGDILLQLHVPNKGICLLRIMLPCFMFIATKKGEYPEPNNFCMGLRKHLSNARLRDIRQIGPERIVVLSFERKEGMLELVVELFARGNLLLLSSENDIIIAKNYQMTKDRTIRGGLKYAYPVKKYNFLTLTEAELKGLIEASDRESIVKTLAMDLGLGGSYAEEACHLAGIDKNKKQISEDEIKELHRAIARLRNSEMHPAIYDQEFSPIGLSKNSGLPATGTATFSEAIEQYFERTASSPKETAWESKYSLEKEKLGKIIETQKAHIEELLAEAAEDQKKGELIYSSYGIVDDVLSSLRKAREKYSWKEIKSRLKGHGMVKEINEKDNLVLIEL